MDEDRVLMLAEAVRTGELVSLDGVISPQTVELKDRFGARGVDMTSLWAATPQNWNCPACGRHKREIVRLNQHQELMCRLVDHHDHFEDLLKQRFREIAATLDVHVATEESEDFAKRCAPTVSAFDSTVVCNDCNNADTNAKKHVRAHRAFSFSPAEIRAFVMARPNQAHEIDENEATRLWQAACPTLEIRLKVVEEMATIAARDDHWYQRSRFDLRTEHIYKHASSTIREYRFEKGLDDLCPAPSRDGAKARRDAWRRRRHPTPARPPTDGEVAHVARVHSRSRWNALPEDWRCPCCSRDKRSIVRLSNSKEWMFHTKHSRPFLDEPEKMIHLCGDCDVTRVRLFKEVLTGELPHFRVLPITLDELRAVITPRPHARHVIDNEQADELVVELQSRLAA